MNVLIVHVHPEPRSFNGALTRTAARALREQGHTEEVSDLYAMKWKPVADADDYAGPREDHGYLRIDREQTFAHDAETTACDIRAEQAKVRRADLVLSQYPMWWFGPPAILKGWFDRVFTRGFAYLPGRKYDTGLMAGKLAMISVTTGTSADTYAPDGIDGAILDILWPVHNGILRYTGFDVLAPFITHTPGKISHGERRVVLGRYADEIRAVASRHRLFFHPRDDYGPDERLRPGVRPQSGFQHRNCG